MRHPLWMVPLLFMACSANLEGQVQTEASFSEVAGRAQVDQVLDDWHAAAASADEARYFGHLAEDAVFLGTDASERWNKAAFLTFAHPHFAKGKAWRFKARRREVAFDSEGRFAWFDEDLVTEKLGPARGSGVLRRDKGTFQIVQYNLASTVPNDRFDAMRDSVDAKSLLEGDASPLATLSWMSGVWAGNAGSARVEESWSAPSGGMMLATGRTTDGQKPAAFEFLRIEQRSDKVVYVAQPAGGAPTEFVLEGSLAAATSRASFVAPEHDYPKRITYTRAGRKLVTRIEGGPGQPVVEQVLDTAVVARK